MLSKRREFLYSSIVIGTAALTKGTIGLSSLLNQLDPIKDGKLLAVLPFSGEGRAAIGNIIGEGLNGRLALDLTKLDAKTLITPNNEFYIRTRLPALIDLNKSWKIDVHGLVNSRISLSLKDLQSLVRPMEVHLLECSGNNRGRGFGLISSAKWSGIPVIDVLKKIHTSPKSTRVLISGFDEHSPKILRRTSSTPGASWIFTFEDLESSGAFFATEMNGKSLPLDHGFPIRLVMPGWYGCSCIKWVNEIKLVDDTEKPTSQMREFASRTHQDGTPLLAKDFQPAIIDQTAMPIRVEQWLVDDKIEYRIIGILWGGQRPTDKLMIRFNSGEKYQPVESYDHNTNKTWTLWAHTWKPLKPGSYDIQITIDDSSIRTRQLDNGYYIRAVKIDKV